MKKLIDATADVVVDALRGMALTHPDDLQVDLENRVVLRGRSKADGKVAIISGGGSGHEPLHGGFVGEGMLDAACAGEVFTSPVPDQITAAIAAVDRGAGVLQIVKNYTGDVMNFEMAAELADAESGTEVRSVVTNDDVAVEDSTFTAGRRGVGGTVLVEKIAGAAAEEGRSLDEVTAIAERVNENARSLGVALTSVTVPANGKPSFELGDDEIEIGIGIHGEPGRRRERIAPAREIARTMLEPILAELPGEGPVLLFVNGMGATPLLELFILAADAHAVLEEAGVEVASDLVGNYITSLDMAGASITLLRLDEELTALWDAPVATPALRRGL
ncbi:dihydroxyacetone kinase subunit DhaK [Brachybacterium sp. MASK1Z-5]|uniref:Dihydroxyacetone kinase subunit DhaK n=1 Tax=Brachybacterium halotolerans TaxID=2795215 RepID=A0ABS1BE84_9MICO|nr:dihydroxyacetone kinase subunit DhaK [Brachybacterium halotolerans]MBK0332320.1 dihydroxyacetone kinase subunit DhaK [Brachybacterium halotolerans]